MTGVSGIDFTADMTAEDANISTTAGLQNYRLSEEWTQNCISTDTAAVSIVISLVNGNATTAIKILGPQTSPEGKVGGLLAARAILAGVEATISTTSGNVNLGIGQPRLASSGNLARPSNPSTITSGAHYRPAAVELGCTTSHGRVFARLRA